MADETTTVIKDTTTTDGSQQAASAKAVTPFDDDAWGYEAPAATEDVKPVAADSTPAPDESASGKPDDTSQVEKVDPKEWLKKELDVEDVAVLRAEREELKKLKATVPEIKYANEESEKLQKAIWAGDKKQVLAILKKQDEIERLTSVEVNENTAAEIIKAAMQIKYKDLDLTDTEIEYRFNKQFGLPAKPVQLDTDSDDEYAQKVNQWEEYVRNTKTEMLIEAKLSRPELQKHKTELVLPDIQPAQATASTYQPSPEDLAAEKKLQDDFLRSAQTLMSSFNGFDVPVKDKDVDFTVAYTLSKEEKELVVEKMRVLAESKFNANDIFKELWTSEDGSLNTEKMVKDLSRLLVGEKLEQKVASEAANKRMEAYIREKKQINVNNTSQTSNLDLGNEKSEMDKVREAAFAV